MLGTRYYFVHKQPKTLCFGVIAISKAVAEGYDIEEYSVLKISEQLLGCSVSQPFITVINVHVYTSLYFEFLFFCRLIKDDFTLLRGRPYDMWGAMDFLHDQTLFSTSSLNIQFFSDLVKRKQFNFFSAVKLKTFFFTIYSI